ncbi:MAG: universal stress protein [Myxococcales bacterium]|nr:universal stress protein [Myxococcales bacterium]
MASARSKADEDEAGLEVRSVVVATDLSRASRAAITRAATLALAPKARVQVVHVAAAPKLKSPAAAARAAIAELERALAAEAAPLLEAAEARGARVELVVVESDDVAVELATRATRARAELVVVGRRGGGRLRELLLGTTAEHVALAARTPVLIAGTDARMAAYTRPLVAVDGEAGSREIVAVARRVGAAARELRVVTAYSIYGEGWLWSGTSSADVQRLRAHAREHARASLADALSPFEGRPRVRSVLREGDARQVLVAEVERYEPDVVVLGARKKRGLGPIRVGRVPAHALRVIDRDLLIVPT